MSENLIRRQRRKSLTDAMVASVPRKPKRYTKADPEQRSHYLRIPPQGPIAYHTAARDPYGKLVWSQNGTADVLKIEESRAPKSSALKSACQQPSRYSRDQTPSRAWRKTG
jgi:hypothetical protein